MNTVANMSLKKSKLLYDFVTLIKEYLRYMGIRSVSVVGDHLSSVRFQGSGVSPTILWSPSVDLSLPIMGHRYLLIRSPVPPSNQDHVSR